MMKRINILRQAQDRATRIAHDARTAHDARIGSTARAKRGFTFTEVLVALLIMVMLATFVASAIPVAFTTYRQVVGDSNAQVALSATASALRDELGLATDVKQGSGTLYYQLSDGSWATIDNGGADDRGLVKHVYANASRGFNPSEPGTELYETDLIPSTMIVGAAGGDDLRVQLSGTSPITYASGVFTISGLQVEMGGNVIESIDEYKVKAVFGPSA